MANLERIKNIVILMMENRSFDHMLGYRSLSNPGAGIEGLSNDPTWRARFANFDQGNCYMPWLNSNPYSLPPGFDPPHERNYVAQHLGTFSSGAYPMNGFVGAIPCSVSPVPHDRMLAMSYFCAEQAPMTEFLANNFLVCDHWYSSLPASTQPNRLMLMSGESRIHFNVSWPMPPQDLVYDWLSERGIRWRVYHQGIPFFALMKKWIGPLLHDHDHFRPFDKLEQDIQLNEPDDMPSVIFVEPVYGDSPHIGRSTDDHAPSGIANGQEFIMQTYSAIRNRPFWDGCLFLMMYDEHGGFFDHVSPPRIITKSPEANLYPDFESLGVRVPAFIVSPFVPKGVVTHSQLDHTSVLKFIGLKFGNGGSYSTPVDLREVGSLLTELDFTRTMADAPAAPPCDEYLNRRFSLSTELAKLDPTNVSQEAFLGSVTAMKQAGLDSSHPQFGALLDRV